MEIDSIYCVQFGNIKINHFVTHFDTLSVWLLPLEYTKAVTIALIYYNDKKLVLSSSILTNYQAK